MRTPNNLNIWGLSCGIDLYGCDIKLIQNPNHIKKYVIELCELIDMVRAGEPVVKYFGGKNHPGPGYSMTQFIETSLISGHFCDETESAYLDVFSCKLYDPEAARAFSQDFFKAKNSTLHITHRI